MDEKDKEALVQNLKDAGCSLDDIRCFLRCEKAGQTKEQLQMLASHRGALLDRVHADERRIDCLDYLVYQIKRNKSGHS